MTVSTLRVLHVISSLRPEAGGPAAGMMPMACALARQPGLAVAVFAGGPADGEPAPPPGDGDGVRVTCFPLPRLGALRRNEVSPALVRRLWTERSAFDLVHTHGTFSFAPALADLLCRVLGKPFVMRPCGALAPWSLSHGSRLKGAFVGALTRPALRAAAFVHCTSAAEAEAIAAVEPAARVRVIPHGVEAASAVGTGTAPPPPDRPYVLFLGRLHPVKGLDLTLAAFAAVADRHPDVELVLAGPDAGCEARLREDAERRGLASRTRFTGFVSGERKQGLLAGARALVLLSHHENFGLAALEAAAAGTPVLVSSRVGLAASIQAWSAGEVTAPSVEAAAASLERILSRPRGAYAGGRLLAGEHSWAQAATLLAAGYRDALGEPARAARGPE